MTDRQIRAVVFDLDGLLVDSEPVQIAAWERFLETHDRQLDADLLGRMFGLRVWDSARLLICEFGLALTVEQVVAERDALFFAMLPGRLEPMPAAVETVTSLRQRGYRLALATSGHRRYVDLVLKTLALTEAFEVEITGDMVTNGKPSPDIYYEAARRLDVSPTICVAVEDAPIGIAAAKGAGMTCLAVPNHLTRNIAGLNQADAILSSLGDLEPWLMRHTDPPSAEPAD